MSDDRNHMAPASGGPAGGHPQPDDEALDWAIRMTDADADWDAFMTWLEGDPRRSDRYDRAVFALAAAERIVAAQPDVPPPVVANDDTAAAPASIGRRGVARWLGGVVAAALVGAIGLGAWDRRGDPFTVSTAAGEQRTIRLADGSSIVLAGASQVRLDHRAVRVAVVERGEVLFRVHHDPDRPFDVRAGDLALTDLGTVFDVRMLGRRTRVAVAEGAVLIDPDGAALRLDPGQAVVADGASLRRQTTDVADIGGWREGRLAYDDATLSDVAEDLSRQLALRISAAPAVAGRKFRGTLETNGLRDDPALIGELLGVRVRQDAGGWMLEARR